ncbi:NADPH-dependent FMN reductase [Fuscibacter oryzae]|nr:NAD(P)H-dependent oxidoreductase [Fuscibacter oryzae]
MKNVAVLVGSLRAASINRRFAEALAKLAEGRLAFRFVEIGDLPIYNDDLWAEPPAAVTRLRQDIAAADAVLLVTPEYNRSYAPALSNAIHWATRPWGQNAWAGKPAAITGTTPGATGTAAGQNALRHLASSVGLDLMIFPEVYWTWKDTHFDGSTLTDAESAKFLSGWIDAFSGFIDRHTKVAA